MNHTAGPWNAPSAGVYAGSVLIASCGSRETVEGLRTRGLSPKECADEISANMRLIAAAPELLEACKAAFYALHNGEGGAEAQLLCSAALAKAEGGGE